MLETKLAARRAALSEQASLTSPAIAIRPARPAARFSLRIPESDAGAVGAVAGLRIDAPLLRTSVAGERLAARLGPNEWLLLAPEIEAEAIQGEIEGALAGRFHSLVDVGHRNAGIELTGSAATAVLNAGCPIDLSDAAFPVGAATRTLLAKAEIVLLRTGPASYRVECWRSFATYVHGFLREAARDFEHS